MTDFKQFADAVNKKFLKLSAGGELFTSNVPKELLNLTYQEAFPDGTNNVFRENPVHQCNTCTSFINRIGGVMFINPDYTIDTIWNVDGLEYPYNLVAKAMHELVSSRKPNSIFKTTETTAGKEFNKDANRVGISYDHFYADINRAHSMLDADAVRGRKNTNVDVFRRALKEFNVELLDFVIDLCSQQSDHDFGRIYRGEEFVNPVISFKAAKVAYDEAGQPAGFPYREVNNYPYGIRSSPIGSLLVDLSRDVTVSDAVGKYHHVVAPENYKHSKPEYTKKQKEEGIKYIVANGFESALERRLATKDDAIEVLYSGDDSQAISRNSLDDLLGSGVKSSTVKSGDTLHIEKFITDILPSASSIEVMVDSKHLPNFVTLVAPKHDNAKNMFKWGNQYSWAYAGGMTDSPIKDAVKKNGGKVDDVFSRFSIMWNNDGNTNLSDLDAHCHRYKGDEVANHISFQSRRDTVTQGELDQDIQTPRGAATENIRHSVKSKMEGYSFLYSVHNYHADSNETGFKAELEIDGKLYSFNHPKPLQYKKRVDVARVTVGTDKVTVECLLSGTQQSVEKWSVNTLQYKKLDVMMLSPNHWYGEKTGNKHYMFMLENCVNPDPVKGFFNEYLKDELRPHRKIFQMLSDQMICEPNPDQLSGLGFSSTKKDKLNVKVDGRPYTITFGGK